MKALKVAAITLLAVVAAGVALMFVGFPAGFLLTPLLDRFATDTGFQLKVSGAATLKLLPTPTIVLNDVSLRDLASTVPEPILAAQSIRCVRIAAESVWGPAASHRSHHDGAGRPSATDPAAHHSIPSSSASPAPADLLSRSSLSITSPFMAGQSCSSTQQTPSRASWKMSNSSVRLPKNRQLDAIVSAQSDGQVLRLTLKGSAPKGGFDGRPLPLDFSFEAPGLLQGALTGSTEVRATRSLIRFNNINGSVAANRFSGWASVDVSDKPLVKVELDFQKLDIGDVRARRFRVRIFNGRRGSAVEHGSYQPRKPELCRCRDSAFRSGTQLQLVPFCADRRQRDT